MRHAGVMIGVVIAAADWGQLFGADLRELRADPFLFTLSGVFGAVFRRSALLVRLALAGLGGAGLRASSLVVHVDAGGGGKAFVAVGLVVTAADRLEQLDA